MWKLWIICSMYCVSQVLHAQAPTEDSLFFGGIVFESDSMKPLVAAHYLVNNDKGGITDQEGHFYFRAHRGDTIQFSYMGYKTVKFIVHDTLPAIEYLLGIRMTKDTIHIRELIIYPRIVGNIYTVMANTQVESKHAQNATQNLQFATYQGLTVPPKWDAEMSQKYAQEQQIKQNLSKGMISPDDMVSFTALIPLAIYAAKRLANPPAEVKKITLEEENRIKSLLFRDVEIK